MLTVLGGISSWRSTRVQSQMLPVAKKGKGEQRGSFYARAEEVMAMLDPIMLAGGVQPVDLYGGMPDPGPSEVCPDSPPHWRT